ncbi:hypothetical protein RNJ44_02901 [Nakaseomyces bracarensis]|uniref:Phospholipid/glycerol acyltransferase domain-containing protein n=1 Tax=Nakaseomyces bracarensis TaxID=273131 RepID=A0ABR4P0L0_9SACH
MEKFSNWRDKGTGIAPFLPNTITGPSTVSKGLHFVWYAVKMVLLLPVMLVVMVIGDKFWHRFIFRVLYGYREDITVVGVKRRQVVPWQHYPLRNNIYVANASSPWDGIVLSLIAEGPSVFLVPNGGVFYRMNTEQYYSFAISGSLDAKKYGKEVASINECKDRVVFMFLEGTCSNGKSVLPFEVTSKQLDQFLYGADERDVPEKDRRQLFTVQVKINSSLVTPLGIARKDYFFRSIMKGVKMKIKISHEPFSSRNLDALRAALMDGDKYKLVSKSLGLEAKRKFAADFYAKRPVK